MQRVHRFITGIDPLLFIASFLLTVCGLVTMYSYVGDNTYFQRQTFWIIGALIMGGVALLIDYRFLKTGYTAFYIYAATIVLLLLIFVFGDITKGAQSRFDLGFFSIQPADPAKLALIIALAKYFSKRHVEIAHFKHILVSGLYAFVIFALVFLQPDFGSAIIIFFIWLGMVLVSGISFRHLAIVVLAGVLAFGGLWTFGFQDYQKDRILTFLNPLADIQGAGYNAYQSTIAVGSGQVLGKGVGYGTQSKLQFLPEYETDFIFAAFAEEWGFVGVLVLFGLFGIVIWRILALSLRGYSNFECLFGIGVATMITAHFFVHVGMNIGLLPVTGLTLPFLSYGGSHLVTEFVALAMVVAMHKRPAQYTALVS